MAACDNPSTPSMPTGTSTPCQCTVVGSCSPFLTVTRTVSPSVTRNSGPGTWPLYAYASTVLPGASSQPVRPTSSSNSLIWPVVCTCFRGGSVRAGWVVSAGRDHTASAASTTPTDVISTRMTSNGAKARVFSSWETAAILRISLPLPVVLEPVIVSAQTECWLRLAMRVGAGPVLLVSRGRPARYLDTEVEHMYSHGACVACQRTACRGPGNALS